MEKVVRDGKVAVLISPNWGTGWFEAGRFDPVIVHMLETNASKAALKAYCQVKYPDDHLYGLESLEIKWVPEGEYFYIHEYDGSEWIVNQGNFYVA